MNGGTAIDLGKMIRALAVQPDDVRAIVLGHRWIVGDAPPLIAARTTAGTGSEAIHFAVVYVDGEKYSLAAPALLPNYAIENRVADIKAGLAAGCGCEQASAMLPPLTTSRLTDKTRCHRGGDAFDVQFNAVFRTSLTPKPNVAHHNIALRGAPGHATQVMAKQVQDREDLLRDGRQMAIRGETTINDIVVTIGFRDAGQMSLYCGPDPVFQFNAGQQLRRVFFAGERYAADARHLVRLDRASRGGKVQFVPKEVSEDRRAAIMQSLERWIGDLRLANTTEHAEWRVADQQDAVFHQQLSGWLDALPQPIEIADSPSV